MKKNLKNFVEAGYKKKSEAKNVNGYVLDEGLSTKRNKVYYDPNTGKAVHTIAGTDSLKDWSNNALIPLGLHEYSNRYKNSEKIQKKANEKYGKSNVDLVSHSQSGNIAENLANKNLVGGLNTALNPAIIGKHNKDIKVVKSILDPVSVLTKTTKKDLNIIPKSLNPITEHSTNILDKTKKNIFGFGAKDIKEKQYNKLMKYNSEDQSECSSSEEEEEHELKGGRLHEQDIIDRIAKLSHDIHVHHQKHGLKPSIIKGFKILGEGIIHSNKPCIVGGKIGGKINRSKKFNSWFKDIGNKFKPLNKNLSPIKHQMTQSAVDNIAYQTMTPEQKLQEGVDMFGDIADTFKGSNKPEKPSDYPEAYYPRQDYYHEMYQPIIAQPVTSSAYSGYYEDDTYDFNSQPSSYARSSQPKQLSGFGVTMFKHGGNDGMNKRETAQQKDNEKYTNAEAMKSTNKAVDIYNKGGFKGVGFIQNEQETTRKPLKGKGAAGKMLKDAAVNATANLINAGSTRAVNEMETRNTTGKGLKKGSLEMKERMAKMRAMRKKK